MCNACLIEAVHAASTPNIDPERDQFEKQRTKANLHARSFSRAVDLTHKLTQDFPSFFGKAFELEDEKTFEADGFNLKRIQYLEHVGTHFDAPVHFSESGTGIETIPVEDLVCPLAVVDVRMKAVRDSDYRMSLEDISTFEREHGQILEGSCVAMLSGWESYLHTEKFRNEDEVGVLHFPGVHEEVAEFLLTERSVKCVAVDTMSLDQGCTTSSPFHYRWLGAGKYGIENVANLAALPPIGSTLVAGAPKFEGATGGPGRVIALV